MLFHHWYSNYCCSRPQRTVIYTCCRYWKFSTIATVEISGGRLIIKTGASIEKVVAAADSVAEIIRSLCDNIFSVRKYIVMNLTTLRITYPLSYDPMKTHSLSLSVSLSLSLSYTHTHTFSFLLSLTLLPFLLSLSFSLPLSLSFSHYRLFLSLSLSLSPFHSLSNSPSLSLYSFLTYSFLLCFFHSWLFYSGILHYLSDSYLSIYHWICWYNRKKIDKAYYFFCFFLSLSPSLPQHL